MMQNYKIHGRQEKSTISLQEMAFWNCLMEDSSEWQVWHDDTSNGFSEDELALVFLSGT
jgi:hypothetical protein